MDILENIVDYKKQELLHKQSIVPIEDLKAQAEAGKPGRGFRKALENSKYGIIAEFKRFSPSKGEIFANADPAVVVSGYQEAGAACCSVLTERAFFRAQPDDFKQARAAASLPLLRKDFTLSEYHVYETKAMDADAILLIASVLRPADARDLAKLAKELGLDTILEIHKKEELAVLNEYIDIVGINNRNLGSFVTSTQNSLTMIEPLKRAVKNFYKQDPPLLISESGITDLNTVKELQKAGYQGFLIGERFMKTHKPAESLTAFLNEGEEV